MESTISCRTIFTNLEHPEKASAPIEVTCSDIATEDKLVQAEKAPCPIDWTLLGILTETTDAQPLIALASTAVADEWNVTDVRTEQSKTSSMGLGSGCGMLAEANAKHPVKASFPKYSSSAPKIPIHF